MANPHEQVTRNDTLRLLIADDSAVIRTILERDLRSAGHEVLAVSDGSQAIAVLREDASLQVALLDWNMPGSIEGEELCQLVSNLDHPVYVIIITGETCSKVTVNALNAGASDYVVKPWVNEVLLARIGVAGRLISMRSQLESATNELQQQIKQQKLLQVQLLHAQKMESIGQLAAGIAHEINTPIQYVGDNARFVRDSVTDLLKLAEQYTMFLASVKNGNVLPNQITELESASEKLDLEFVNAEVPKALEQTLEGVDRVAEIVRAMKDFSHPDGEEKTPTDLNKAIESTITVCRNRWKYVADMETDFEDGLPLTPCRLGEFNQVILNIIINAADAIGEIVGDGATGKGRIVVSTRQDGAFVEIRVIDTGGGIPQEIQQKVFDPFFTTKQVGKGTGQGLAICHDVIVNKHGGTIDLENEPGRGATFIIRLPISLQATEGLKEAA